jgi:hypothetical protein
MRTDRENFFDEDVLRIQNEVRRYKNEQERISNGDGDDKMQRGDGTGADTDTLSDKSRSNFLQNTFAAAQRK